MGVAMRRRRLQMMQLKDKRKKVQEEVIPSDAKPIDPKSGMTTDDQKDETQRQDSSLNISRQTSDQVSDEELLPMSLALVAPTSTPNWNKPLPPMGVAPISSPQISAPVVSSPVQPDAKKLDINVGEMLKMSRPTKLDGTTPSPLSESVSHRSGEELLGQGKPMPEHTNGNSSKSFLGRVKFT
jgi:hypothetical protein